MSTYDEMLRIRKEKLAALRKLGIDPYPEQSTKTDDIGGIREQFAKLSKSRKAIGVAGRLTSLRFHGGAVFGDLKDQTGKLQVLFKKDTLKDKFDFLQYLDVGDFVWATGSLFLTAKGEQTLEAKNFGMLAKAMRPIPPEWSGLQDEEARSRKRYVDLLVNQDVYERFRKRFAVLQRMREYLYDMGFTEVDTPILQPLYGGANAKPFKTYHNALGIELFLRIAPELYLKRLTVGGFDKVFEIGKNFRNEGIDREHNPEFTVMELYWAYQDRDGLMEFTENLFQTLFKEFIRTPGSYEYQDITYKLKTPYPRLSYSGALKQAVGLTYDDSRDALEEAAKAKGLKIEYRAPKYRIADEIIKKLVYPTLTQPTFLVDHPVEISPLAKSDGKTARRFQLVVSGLNELCNAWAEINDPEYQREQFLKQEGNRKAGDEEAQRYDEDYVEALEYGMPPTAGIGIGLDRLIAFLTGAPSLKEVIPFPTLRPKE